MKENVQQYDHAKLLADHIRRIRGYMDISQETLAQQAKISNKTVQNIEECKTDPRLSSIAPICKALRLDARLFITPELITESPYLADLSLLLSDCNDAEASAIINVVRNVKDAIRCNSSSEIKNAPLQ